jgi:sphingolipid delta-4 desaturase
MEIGNSSYYTSYNYIWTYSDEPHATRRKQILQKYPQIRELYGYEWSTKWIVICWVILQILVCYLVRNSSWWTIILTSYCIGAFASHALVLAMHEISHNLAFEKPIHNKLLGFFANLATVFPYYSLFQKYHMEHHQYQGVLGIDTDIPTELEKKIFVKSIFKKMIWVFFQLLFYAIRPLWIKPKIPGISEFINIICCIIFDFIIIYYFGFKSLSYLILSLFLGN